MRYALGPIALLVILSCHAEVCSHPPFVYGANGYPPAGGFGLGYQSRRFSFSYFNSSSYDFGLAPYPYYAFPPPSVNVYYYPLVPPPVAPTPPILINQPIVVAPAGVNFVERVEDDRFLRFIPRNRPREEMPREAPAAPREEAPLPGAPAGKFRPIAPKERGKVLPAAPAAPPVPAAPPAERPKPRPAPRPAPLENPKEENLTQGRKAFALQEYGRAERRFQQAALLAPDEALGYFLLAQAQFALGKYQEAVESIEGGMRLRPEWPGVRFPPRALYGANEADCTDHLRRLADTLARHPRDPLLLFLYAYELWFDGRPAEARELFQRAARFAPDRTFIDRFLKALPGVPVAKEG